MPALLRKVRFHIWQRLTLVAVIMVLVQCFALLSTSPAYAQDASLTSEEQHILDAINWERSQAGLGPLSINGLLNQAAQAHADDILTNSNYSHWGTDGTLARDRVARTGYSDAPWVSENWVSSRSPQAAMTWWMNDYIHMVNILTPRWREIGVGAAIDSDSGRMVFVTVFSAGRDSRGVQVAQSPVRASSATSVQPLDVPAGGTNYVIRQGDTLLAVALRYGYDYAVLAEANSLNEHSILQIGQVIRIPGSGDGAATGTGGPVDMATIAYEVEAGDTLISIASRFGLLWEEVAEVNGLGERSLLQIGMTVQIPDPDGTLAAQNDAMVSVPSQSEPSSVESDVTTATDVEEASGADTELAVLHVVEEGETLFGIALRNHVSLKSVLNLNHLKETSVIQPGMVIRLR